MQIYSRLLFLDLQNPSLGVSNPPPGGFVEAVKGCWGDKCRKIMFIFGI